MLKVQRFFEHMKTHMQNNQTYFSIPYDYPGTDTLILGKFEQWKADRSIDIISITGPLVKDIPAGGGCCESKGMEMTVVYQEKT